MPYASVVQANLALLGSQSTPRVRALLGMGLASAETAPEHEDDTGIDIAAAPPEQRAELIEGFLKTHVGRALGYSASSLEVHKPLSDLGFDSLMAVQVRNAIKASLHVDISLRDLLSGITISEATGALEDLLGTVQTGSASSAPVEEWEEGTI